MMRVWSVIQCGVSAGLEQGFVGCCFINGQMHARTG